MLQQFNTFFNSLNKDAKIRFAQNADTTVSTLYNFRTKGYQPSAAFSARVEEASRGRVDRTDTCKTCAECPYVKMNRGELV